MELSGRSLVVVLGAVWQDAWGQTKGLIFSDCPNRCCEDRLRGQEGDHRALRSSRTSSRGAEGDRRESAAVGGSFVIEFAELVKKSVHVVHEAGWDRVGLDETLGGIPTPKALI